MKDDIETLIKRFGRSLAIAVVLSLLALPAFAQEPTPTPDPYQLIEPELIEKFRITTPEIAELGNWYVNAYMLHEEDALVLTRTALPESPESLDDRILVMWLIRIRADLGYKNAKWAFSGTVDRFGPPSTIKMEALCIGGCQFEVWRAAQYVTNPAKLASTGILRLMLHPRDEDLMKFYETYQAALEIVNAPLSEAPELVRGYDGFLSPGASDTHFRDWKPNGLLRLQHYEGGNVWIDYDKRDNFFFEMLPFRTTPSITPSAVPTEVPTMTPTTEATPTATSDLLATAEALEPAVIIGRPEFVSEEKPSSKGVLSMDIEAALTSLLVVGLLVEAVVESVKPLWDASKREDLPDRIAALVVGEAVSVFGGFDIFHAAGVPLANFAEVGAWPGIVLTGILLSRGAGVLHSLVQSIWAMAKSRLDEFE
jgi:hypothetical protein